ncbi:MAG: hypothetical protein RLZZ623_2486 [Actinomycetota bacterium]
MIIGVGAWRGVGATTTAVAIAAGLAAQGERPWLIEADPAGGVLAARFALAPALAGSLERLAFPASASASASASVLGTAADSAVDIAGVRLITAPGDPFRAWGCHAPRFPWQPALRELDGPVVIDLGTLRGGAPNHLLMQQLELLLLISTADVVDAVSTLEWAASRGRPSPDDRGLALDITRVAVVDAPTVSTRASRSDLEAELGERYAGWLPWAPDAVDLLHRGAGFNHRRLRRHAFSQGTEHLIHRVRGWMGSERAA